MSAPGFHRVLAAEAVSKLGSMLSRLAIPWLATLVLGATALQMAALLAVEVLVAAIGGLALAPWVDRGGKRGAMLAADGVRALVLALLALAAWQGRASMALLLAAAAVSGLAGTVFDLARSAWIAQRVATGDLPTANARLAAVGSLSETLAFAAGGWLFQALGAAVALVVDAASFVLSALCLRGIPAARPAPVAADALPTSGWRQAWTLAWRDATAGVRRVARHPGLRRLALIEWLLAAGGGLFGTCFMIFVTRDVGYAPGPLGLVFACGALGALAGAGAAPALGRRLGPAGAMATGLALLAAGNACVPLAAAGGAAGLALLVLHQLVGDGGHVLHDIHDRTLRQTLVDAGSLAQADAGIRAAGHAATLAAALVGGWIGNTFGARQALVLAVALFALAAGLALSGRSRLQRT